MRYLTGTSATKNIFNFVENPFTGAHLSRVSNMRLKASRKLYLWGRNDYHNHHELPAVKFSFLVRLSLYAHGSSVSWTSVDCNNA
jgi:hypothetical protein